MRDVTRWLTLGGLAACGSPTPTTSPPPPTAPAAAIAPPRATSSSELPTDVHGSTRAYLEGHRFVVLAEDGVVFHGTPPRLSPISVADVTADGTPDVVLRRGGEILVFRGERLGKPGPRREVAPTERHAPSPPLAPETRISHSGQLWTRSDPDPSRLVLSSTLGGPRVGRVERFRAAYHLAGGVVLVGETQTRFVPARLPAADASFVTIRGGSVDPRYFSTPDFDGDGQPDGCVLAHHHTEHFEDDMETGAIWFVSSKQLAAAVDSTGKELRLPEDAAFSVPRLRARGGYEFASPTNSVVYGDTLIAGSTIAFDKTAEHISYTMQFHRYDLSRGLPKAPAHTCTMRFERAGSPLGYEDHSARLAGVADFDGDGHLDVVVWEEGHNPTTGKRGRVFVGFGPYCQD